MSMNPIDQFLYTLYQEDGTYNIELGTFVSISELHRIFGHEWTNLATFSQQLRKLKTKDGSLIFQGAENKRLMIDNKRVSVIQMPTLETLEKYFS